MNILICDDESLLLELYESELSQIEACQIFTAADGLEGLEILTNNEIDILLTDGKMPRMDGIKLVNEASRKGVLPRHVYLITGYHGEYKDEELKEMGIQKIIDKPVDFDWLINFVTKLD